MGRNTRHRFRRPIVPGTTRKHRNSSLTALPEMSLRQELLHCGTLPALSRLNHLLDFMQAPKTTSEAQRLTLLALIVEEEVTSLEGVILRNSHRTYLAPAWP